MLTTFKVSYDKLESLKYNIDSFMNILIKLMIFCIVVLIVTGSYLIIFTNIIQISSLTKCLLYYLLPFISIACPMLAFLTKKRSKNIKKFNHLKNKLDQYQIDNENINEQIKTFDLLIKKQINELALSLSELEKLKKQINILNEQTKKYNQTERISYLKFCINKYKQNIEEVDKKTINEEKPHTLTKKYFNDKKTHH